MGPWILLQAVPSTSDLPGGPVTLVTLVAGLLALVGYFVKVAIPHMHAEFRADAKEAREVFRSELSGQRTDFRMEMAEERKIFREALDRVAPGPQR